MNQSRFLKYEISKRIRKQFGSPVYVYDEKTIKSNAQAALNFPNSFGLTVRYAMKASPNASLLRRFKALGVNIDASSGFEVLRAFRAGYSGEEISLSSQEWYDDFQLIHDKGIKFNACSLSQLENFGQLNPEGTLGIRFNPGQGSGGTGKTNVGGPDSSFGIWYELMPEVLRIVSKYNLKVERIHTHIGSGSDPEVWQKVSKLSIDIIRKFPDAKILNLGGGFKIGRMPDETTTDLQVVGKPVAEAFLAFEKETGRKLHLEIEPGTWLIGNACSILATVKDIVSTGESGHKFIKTDTGMTEILRPSLYAAQHPIHVLKSGEKETENYIVVGHCCESGDLLTPSPSDPEKLQERELLKANIGDLLVIDGAGAYCSSMSAKNYNTYPEAAEVILLENGDTELIRKRQTLDQILQNEVQA